MRNKMLILRVCNGARGHLLTEIRYEKCLYFLLSSKKQKMMSDLSAYGELLAILGEQVAYILEVEFDIGAGDEVRDIGRCGGLYVGPQVAESSRDNALLLRRALHRVSLACARLPVREHAPIEPIQHGRHQRPHLHTHNITQQVILESSNTNVYGKGYKLTSSRSVNNEHYFVCHFSRLSMLT